MGFAIGAAIGACGSGVALGASSRPTVRTARGCYLVGQPVAVGGIGFAPLQLYDIAIGGVDFGRRTTNAAGAFLTRVSLGGLTPGIVQHVEFLNATDGTSEADTRFTLTRRTGAKFSGSGPSPATQRGSFQAWGFGLDGRRRPVYLHYVGPSGRARSTVLLGQAGGQCGYLQTRRRSLFPFGPSSGRWTLQLDSLRSYRRRPNAPVARIFVTIA